MSSPVPHRSCAALAALALLLAAGTAACKSAGSEALAQAEERVPGLRLVFEGNASFTRSELLDAIAEDLRDLSEDGLDRPDVDDLAYSLEVFYRRQGFPDAYVSYQLGAAAAAPEGEEPPAEGGGATARFLVDEGRRARVEELVLTGDAAAENPDFAAERVLPFFSPPTGFFEDAPWWFVRSELERGASALQDYYRAKGYLEATVEAPEVEWLSEERTQARVAVQVAAGPLWVLAEVELDTPPDLPDDRRRTLARLLEAGRRDDSGQLRPYTLRLAYALRAKLLERLGEWGHPNADCDVEETELGDGRMRVRFDVRPGPLVRVADVVLRGNEKTRANFLRHRVTLEPGDVVDTRELRRSFARLFETGLFRTVTIDLAQPGALEDDPTATADPTGEAGRGTGEDEAAATAEPPPEAEEIERDLVVEVLELPSIEVTLEPGYGSYEKLRLRLGVEDRNVLGTGRTAEVETTLGLLAQKVSLGLGDRALFDSEYAGSSALYYDRREEPSFTLQERGLALSVSRAWRERSLEASLGYRFRRSDVSDVEVVDELVEEALAQIDISSIALTVARDTRDRFFAPTDGSFVRAQLEWASALFGSELDFVSARVEASSFRALPWPGAVLATGLETGLIAPIGATDVIPLQVRLFNGGENTVRSFHEDELGNLDENGEPIGGEAYSVLSIELRQHLAGPVSGALFYDAGNLEPDHEQYLDFDDMRQGIGFGLRYDLPIGPVRLDAAWNPDDRSNEDDWVVHLAVGLSF